LIGRAVRRPCAQVCRLRKRNEAPRLCPDHSPTLKAAMTLSTELERLRDLHARGALSDEEFLRAKSTLIDEAMERKEAGRPSPAMAAVNALRRSTADRWISGVCGGIARSTGLEAWVVRLLFAVLLLWGGAGLLLYVLLWVFVPSD